MQKVIKTIKENRVMLFIFGMVLLYLICLFFIKGVFKSDITLMQIVFIFAIGCFTYVDVFLVAKYLGIKKTLNFLEKIREQFEYFEIYTEGNSIIVEILKIEQEKFFVFIEKNNFEYIELLQKDQMIQYIVKG